MKENKIKFLTIILLILLAITVIDYIFNGGTQLLKIFGSIIVLWVIIKSGFISSATQEMGKRFEDGGLK